MSIKKNEFSQQTLIKRNNVNFIGEGEQVIILAHGFGCHQNMWRFLTPYFKQQYRIMLFDYVGSGESDCNAFNSERYSHLEGYAQDIIELCDAFELSDCIFIGHSVSATIGWIVGQKRPELISHQVSVCPSPCFLNLSEDYKGGFAKEDLEGLVALMSQDYIGWGQYLAPLVMGSDLPAGDAQINEEDNLVLDLLNSFCSTDVTYSLPFAKATFFSDNRGLLADIEQPCLIIQSTNDALVSMDVAKYMSQHIPQNQLATIEANGHCLHMTHPGDLAKHINHFLGQ